ncbi:GGDEF domain-containing protein [Rhodococcoides kyotonense]|uniref:Diguanylate cyclase (GGDEF) domain-containing protein n=1 Tax=Rhodococcoides kyotonense TaxID=398843 RepID=A0A239KD90_9NOCA|nr:GGDEF domain-containing protein [Rhodococcus kyotonensis]SNT15682.1 diguanylate cyclase (GGDEF) domain-containing protein [Rhodococcus kyotonensis]
MLFGGRGPQGFLPEAWVGIMLLIQLAVALRWFFGPLPVRRDFIGFAVFGDVGLTSVLVLYEPLGGLIGCGLFVVTGALCTYFLSQKLLLAHLLWCTAFIAIMIVRAAFAGTEDVVTVLAVGIVILGINTGIPLLAHIAWTAIGRDARRSLVDPLTGLLNRRGLDDAAEELVTAGQHRGHCLVVLVIDIDRFKQVNDYFGHDTGDRVIVRMSDRLAELFRVDGVVARTGGEEFVVVFSTPFDNAHDRIGQVGHALYRREDQIPVTVSVGAAIIPQPTDMWGGDLSVVTRATRAADSMMYRAKYDGGNRTASTFL